MTCNTITFATINFDAVTFDEINAGPGGGTFNGDWTFTNPLVVPELLADTVNADVGIFDIIIMNPTPPPLAMTPYPYNYIWLPDLGTHLMFGTETFAFLSDIPATPAQPWITLQPFPINPGGVFAATTIWLQTGDTRPSYGSTQLALLSDVTNSGFIDLTPFGANPGGISSIWQNGLSSRPDYGNSGQIALLSDVNQMYITLSGFAANPGTGSTFWLQTGDPRPSWGNSGQMALLSDIAAPQFIDLASFASNPGGPTSIWQMIAETRPRYGNSGQIALVSDLTFLDMVPFLANPGDGDTIWQESGQPRPGYGSTEQLALLSDVTGSTVINTNPILDNLVVYGSSTVTPASIKTADAPATISQTLIANMPLATQGGLRVRPNSDIAGNVFIQSLPGADLGYSTMMFNGFNTGAGGVTRYNAGKAAWRIGVNQTGLGDQFFIDLFTVSAFPIMGIDQATLLINAVFGFSSIRYDLLSSLANPGGATTIWQQTAQPRPGYGTTEQLALLSDVTAITVTSTNPILNNLVVYASSGPTIDIKTADAPATISQTLIANSTAATTGYFRARPNSDAAGNISIQSLPGADLGYSSVMFNGFNTGAGGVTRYNAAKAAWRAGVDQTGGNDFYFIDLFTVSAFPVMTINQSDRLITAAVGFSSIRYDLVSSLANPGGATTIWLQTGQPRPGYGSTEQLALLSDITGSGTVVNTNPILNQFVIYNSSGPGTSIKSADAPASIDQTIIANMPLATQGGVRVRPNSDAAGNIFLQSLPGADLGYSTVMFNGFNTGAGGVTLYNAGKAAWRTGVDQTGGNDFYFIDLFTVSAFPVMTINQSDRLITAAVGFSSTRYDLVSSLANPGGATTIWLQTGQPRPGYGSTEQLALLSDVTAGGVVVNTNPILNQFVIYNSSGPGTSIKSADAPASIDQTIIANMPLATQGGVRVRPNSDVAGNIFLQSLPGADLGYSTVMFNGFNTGAGGVTRYNAGKAAWRVGVDQTGANDLYFIDFFTVAAFPVMTINQADRLINSTAGFSSIRYDLVASVANPGGATTIWLQTAQPRPGYGAQQLALLSDVTGSAVINTNPLLNQLVVYASSTVSPASIKSADVPASIDQTLICNMPLATQGGLRVRPNSDAAGNVFIQSLPGANLGYSNICFNGFNTGAGITRYNAAKGCWRINVDQQGGADQFNIDLVTTISFPVLQVNLSDRLIRGTIGYFAPRFDISASAANPGALQTIWTDSTTGNSLRFGSGVVLVNAAPSTTNAIPVYTDAAGRVTNSSTATPATLSRPIAITGPTGAGLNLISATMDANTSGAIKGPNMTIFNTNATNDRAFIQMGKSTADGYELGVDYNFNGTKDFYLFRTGSGGGRVFYVDNTVGTLQRVFQVDSGVSTLRYDIVSTLVNPGGTNTLWFNSVADPLRPRFGANVLALTIDPPPQTSFDNTVGFTSGPWTPILYTIRIQGIKIGGIVSLRITRINNDTVKNATSTNYFSTAVGAIPAGFTPPLNNVIPSYGIVTTGTLPTTIGFATFTTTGSVGLGPPAFLFPIGQPAGLNFNGADLAFTYTTV